MLEKVIHLNFVMHCERLETDAHGLAGPRSLADSERSIRGVADFFEKHDGRCEFHPVPDLAREQSALYRELMERGFAIGMHFHCESWRDGKANRPLGLYGETDQRCILSKAVEDYERALGFRPKSFSAGNFSLTEATYSILIELGFEQSASCLPGRYYPNWGANWLGAFPFVHRANTLNRLCPGNQPLWEFPIASHPSKSSDGLNHYDVRVDHVRSASASVGGEITFGSDFYGQLVAAHFRRECLSTWPAKSIGAFTHNYFDFSNPKTDQSQNLECLLDACLREAKVYGFRLAVSTTAQARESMENFKVLRTEEEKSAAQSIVS